MILIISCKTFLSTTFTSLLAEPVASSEENSHGTTEAAKDFILDGRHYEHRVSQVKTDRE